MNSSRVNLRLPTKQEISTLAAELNIRKNAHRRSHSEFLYPKESDSSNPQALDSNCNPSIISKTIRTGNTPVKQQSKKTEVQKKRLNNADSVKNLDQSDQRLNYELMKYASLIQKSIQNSSKYSEIFSKLSHCDRFV